MGKRQHRKTAKEKRKEEEARKVEAVVEDMCRKLDNMSAMLSEGFITRKQWIVGSIIYLLSLVAGIYGMQYLILRLMGYYS